MGLFTVVTVFDRFNTKNNHLGMKMFSPAVMGSGRWCQKVRVQIHQMTYCYDLNECLLILLSKYFFQSLEFGCVIFVNFFLLLTYQQKRKKKDMSHRFLLREKNTSVLETELLLMKKDILLTISPDIYSM